MANKYQSSMAAPRLTPHGHYVLLEVYAFVKCHLKLVGRAADDVVQKYMGAVHSASPQVVADYAGGGRSTPPPNLGYLARRHIKHCLRHNSYGSTAPVREKVHLYLGAAARTNLCSWVHKDTAQHPPRTFHERMEAVRAYGISKNVISPSTTTSVIAAAYFASTPSHDEVIAITRHRHYNHAGALLAGGNTFVLFHLQVAEMHREMVIGGSVRGRVLIKQFSNALIAALEGEAPAAEEAAEEAEEEEAEEAEEEAAEEAEEAAEEAVEYDSPVTRSQLRSQLRSRYPATRSRSVAL
jgi:hypothetical protein